jgi:hypothetical protein
MQHGEVGTPELAIGPRSERGRLSQDPAEKRVALLGDLAEVYLSAEEWMAGAKPT